MSSVTPKDLARARKTLLFNRLRKSSVPVADSSNDPIEAGERGTSIALSYAQQRLWFLSQLSGSEAYHIHGGVRLRGDLDREALKRALDRIVERHESLRTCFVQQDGEAVQKIGPAQGFALREEELVAGAEQEGALRALSQAQSSAAFDLQAGPLIRGCLVRLGPQEHVLLVTMHHIVSDGWSMGILMKEFSALYEAYSRAAEDPLPPLAIQYADYALWQRRHVQGEVLERQSRYWQKQLGGAPGLLQLPSDRERGSVQSYAGGSVAVSLGAELSRRLKRVSERNGLTLFMSVLSGWAYVLSRLSGQAEVVIGTAVANRTRGEIEGLIGFFVNTLALRIEAREQGSVLEYVRGVKEVVLGAQSHQELPFEQVVELLKPQRSLSHSPIFQVMLAWQNATQEGLTLSGVELEAIAVEQRRAQFDLSLSLGESGRGEIVGELGYASSLFEGGTIERYVEYLKIALTELVESLEQSGTHALRELEILPPAEREQVLRGWNQTHTDYPQQELLQELFEGQVQRTPDAVAVVYEQQSLTYRELNERANRVAHALLERGVGPDVRVGLYVERSAEMVIGILGVLKAGGAYVPLDPGYPLERLEYMLTDSAPRVLLTQSSLQDRLKWLDGAVLRLDEPDLYAGYSAENIAADRNGQHRHQLAYVIYTSGSTGHPKGVMVEHQGLCNLVLTFIRELELDVDSRALQFSSVSFDVCISEIMTTLCCGARLCVPRAGELLAGEVLAEMIASHEATHMSVSPVALGSVPLDERLQTLKVLAVAGEACSSELVRRYGPGRRFINAYGPTEGTVYASAYRCDPQDERNPPIGRPIANTQIYILDSHGRPVPVGVSGELYIGGAGVARGYLNREELTRERFVADPFSGEAGARMYRTGDVGRWSAQGSIEYLGRNDQQVKLRGFRIELGEIESRLLQHAAVREAVVVVREDTPTEKRLIGYVTLHEGQTFAIEELRAHIKEKLPEYMVPAAIVQLQALPLTPNGKVDRKGLPAPEGTAYSRGEYEAPQGEAEQALAQIWQEVLKVERVGRHDNFFELGGHSLLAVRVVERLRQAGWHSEVGALFLSPTLREFGERMQVAEREVPVPPNQIPPGCEHLSPQMLPLVSLEQAQIDRIEAAVPGAGRNIQDIYPLAPLQEGLLFHHLMSPQGDAYVLPTVMSFDTAERLERFVEALGAVIARHDILRTAVLWEGLNEPVQVVLREAPLVVEPVQLQGSGEQAVRELKGRFDPQHYRLDVREAPLIRGFRAHDVQADRWLLLLLSHHLICDHTTLEIILQEVQLHLQGTMEQLREPVPFRTFVARTRNGVTAQEHEQFFRQMLADIEEPTAPFELLSVQGDGTGIEEARLALPDALSSRIREQARVYGVSAASVFHLAWAQVLSRVSGRESVVFGTVLLGRMQALAGMERALGMFINTLPIRIDVDSRSTRNALRDTHALLAQLMRHEHAPLALAQRCSAVPATLPLFSSLVNYRYSAPAAAGESVIGWEGMQLLESKERTNYPLGLLIDDLSEGFAVTAQTSRSVGPGRLCEYLKIALTDLVEALEQSGTRALRELEILPPAEREQVVRGWNQTHTDYPQHELLQELFEGQVQRTPDAVAVVYEQQSLTYRELNERANRVAHALLERGVGPDVRVGLYVERSLEMVIGILGVLKAGGGYVPLDPGYPLERLQYMLTDSAPRVLLTQSSLQDRLKWLDGSVLRLDEPDLYAGYSGANIAADRNGQHRHQLAYVIYTSGSTGHPKGVMVEHRSLINVIYDTQQQYALSPEDRVLQFVAISFDVAGQEIFSTLLSGARLVLRTQHWLENSAAFWRLCESNAITVVTTVSSFLNRVISDEAVSLPSSLRIVVIGGEPIDESFLAQWMKSTHGKCRLLNEYGPTETTITATLHEVKAVNRETARCIGQPIANTQIYILDSHGRPVPVGVSGELYIAGAGVARGYLNREELTRERFVFDPFSGEAGARMYRTGDVGRWSAQGSIEYLGRNDQQVKLRGFRIELGEIESRLLQHAAVREAVVVVREDTPTEKRLIGYVTLHEGQTFAIEELRAHIKEKLPEYMVPAAIVQLQALPLTPNGKVDRKGLPAPEGTAYSRGEYEAPQGEAEQALAQIWQEVLKLERVGRHDNFFELGGHSLLAVRVVSRIREQLGVELPLQEVFAHGTLEALAGAVSSGEAVRLPRIEAGERGTSIALSYAQQRLWFLSQLSGVSEAYHIHGGVRLRGDLDREALKRALDRIVERHESLRTCFVQQDGEAVQKIGPAQGFALREEELVAGAEQEDALRALSQAQSSAAFDLQAGPLIRGCLVRLGPQEHVLLVTMHHIVSDGWSMGILMKEFSALYEAYSRAAEDPLPPLAIQYADYALWQRRHVQGEVLERQSRYWQKQLGGAPGLLQLPSDRERGSVQSYAGGSVAVSLGAELSRRLKRVSERNGLTLFMSVLSGWAYVLSRLSGQAEVVIGTAVANRTRGEIEGLIGFFVNTLALRIEAREQGSVLEYVRGVKEVVLGAQSHQELPFEQVVELLKPQRSLSHSPIFQVMLAWQNATQEGLTLSGVELEAIAVEQRRAQFDLSLSLGESGRGEIVGELGYASSLFEAVTIERYVEYLKIALTELVESLEQSGTRALRTLEILPPAEREQVLRGWNQTHTDYPQHELLQELFEQQVERTPDAVAVVYEQQSLTYRELNERANRVAHALLERGVGPDVRVGLYVERSLEMVIGILGILKAGGGYVPLDPGYPLERLQYMLTDSAPRVLLTQSSLQDRLKWLDGSVLRLDEPDLYAGYSAENIAADRNGQHRHQLAYVIYTSGSTGHPKGVMVEHRNVLELLCATQPWFEFSNSDVWTLFHSYGFDFSVWELWGALCYGGKLVVVPQAVSRDPQSFYELLCEQEVTILNQTPSAFRQLIQAQSQSERGHRLRKVIFGGEALELKALAPWYERNGEERTQLINMYGITETTVHVTYRALSAADVDQYGSASPIGVRLPHLRAYILDSHGRPVPVGVSGELYIGGAGVARGYLNREELTRERFVSDPFSGEAGARMYRTGDVGRWSAQGSIEYLGRNDQQVKLRGFRIELGEIESRLLQHAAVREAVVVVREDTPTEKRLIGYVTLHEGQTFAIEELRAHIKEKLPEYMVPSGIVHLEALPLTPNGKVDRKGLPAPEGTAYSRGEYEAPQGEVEEALAQIWQEVLKLERVGRHDNFFELGGHSLLAVRVVERLRQAGWHSEVGALFLSPTLREFGERMQVAGQEVEVPQNQIPPGCEHLSPQMLPLVSLEQAQIDRIEAAVPGAGRNIQDIYPLAPLQEGLLFHHLMSPQGDAYVLPTVMSFDTAERLERFVEALRAVIARHDILRTAVLWEGLNEPVQVVLREAPLVVEPVQLQGSGEAAVRELKERFSPQHYRLDVREAPMIRGFRAHDVQADRWLLLLLSHHLIDDASSLRIIIQEVQAYVVGRFHELPAPIPFRSFVARTRNGVTAQEHEQFFRQMLADIEEPTAPFELLSVQGDGTGIEEARLALPDALSSRIREQARVYGVSAASVFHLAWAQVLSRVSGREAVVFGTVLLGRMQALAGMERALGMFINTLPIRIDVDGRAVSVALARTHQLLAQLMRHEHASLSLAQRCSAVPATLPLFSSLLNYRYSAPAAAGESVIGWEGMQLLESEERTNYPLALMIDDLGEGFAVTAQTSRSVGPGRICEYLKIGLTELVETLEQSGTRALRTLEILPPAEREQVLRGWNQTHTDYPQHELLQELFEGQVQRTPDAVAVVYERQALTYRELNERANRLAHALLERGVGPDVRVALHVERSLEMVIGILGVLKAGGAYVPLDPGYPLERLEYMLTDSAPRVLLTQSSLQDRLKWLDGAVLRLDEPDLYAGYSAENIAADRNGQHRHQLAYVIYTSGSTGHPKGVMVEHQGLCNLVLTFIRELELDVDSRALQFSSVSFDVCISEIMTTLCCGARLCVPRAGELLAGEVLAEMIASHEATHMSVSPVALGSVPLDERLQTLKVLAVAGEACSSELVRRYGPGRRFINAYGPTEGTVYASAYRCDPQDERNPPIGRPIANTQIYILDSHGRPVPVGVSGELYIGGAGVARGYLNREELTRERFVADPFSGEAGARMYRTGDVGRWSAQGSIEYLGRNDQQVKLRGFRIELGEIESRLLQHAAVREAVVVVREDTPTEKRLIGYVTLREGQTFAIEELRTHIKEKLPEYMVPAAIVQLAQLPLTPNGKVDRKALPAPEGTAYSRGEYEAPQGEAEQALAQIWQEVLKLERVGRHDNFFELGGHSLLAVRVVERLRQAGWHSEVGALFLSPTLREFGERMQVAEREVPVPPNQIPPGCEHLSPQMLPLVSLEQAQIDRIEAAMPGAGRNIQDIYPLTPLQEGLLFHHLMSPQGDAYVLPTVMSFDTAERLERFVEALRAVIGRHDILRTAVLWEGLNEPVQVVLREAPLVVEPVQLQGSGEAAVQELKGRFDPQHYRLDVREAPLIRGFRAHDVQADRWLLLLLNHHLICDHTTLEIILQEVQLHLQGTMEQLREPVPFRSFVARTRNGVTAQEHEQFFRQMLADIEEPTAPFELLSVQRDGTGIEEARLALPDALSSRIREQARVYGVSAASVFHLAWAQVLSRVSGRESVVFGTVLLGRMQALAGMERALGMFINTLPVRLDVDGRATRNALSDTHALLAQLMRHEHASLALAQRCSAVPATLPLFSSLLNYRYTTPIGEGESAIRWEGMQLLESEERTNYPLVLMIDDLGEQFVVSAQVVHPLQASRLCEYLKIALTELVESLEQSGTRALRTLEILPLAEREQVLRGWNQTHTDYPQHELLQELFEGQVQRTPDAVAVVYEQQSLTYRELNERANRVAHALLERGVGPDVRVGLYVERSLEMVIGILGILKAGGGYVPLDPGYPLERLQYMLTDSAPRVLLTQSSLQDRLKWLDGAVLRLDEPDLYAGYSAENIAADRNGQHRHQLAYVIYTSGSTGHPKGVMVEHRNVLELLCATQPWFEFSNSDVWTLFHSYGFDFSVWELWGALCYGGKLVVVPQAVSRDPQSFYELLCEQEVTILNQTPSAFRQLIQAQSQSERGHRLRKVIFGGEALELKALAPWYERNGEERTQLINMYGITETTVHVTYRALSAADVDQYGSASPIGVRLPHLRAYILDSHGRPVPVGVSGELYIGGAGVARGYLNREELTRERFVSDPFSGEADARMYRTGDVGRWSAQGSIEYLGRNDQQVKLRGFRIELGEIESRLLQHAAVREAVVVVREDTPTEKRLIGYVTLHEGQTFAIEELRTHIKEKLPEYMVPAGIVHLEALPLTPNGKVDRKALPAPEGTAYSRGEYEAPQGEVEQALAQIWQEVLKVERVGRHDNFFELGGHSLLAVRVVERLRQVDWHINVVEFYSSPTLCDLAQRAARETENIEIPPNKIPQVKRFEIRI